MEEQRPLVKLTDVNPYILCVLCRGYIVDATSIAECLHSCEYIGIVIIIFVVIHAFDPSFSTKRERERKERTSK